MDHKKHPSERDVVLDDALRAWSSFGFYRDLLLDETINLAHRLCQSFNSPRKNAGVYVGETYWQLFSRLVGYAELSQELVIGDAWQNFFLDKILKVETSFSRKAEFGAQTMGQGMQTGLAMELATLQVLYRLTADWWQGEAQRYYGRSLPLWSEVKPISEEENGPLQKARIEVKRFLTDSPDWSQAVPELIEYYQKYGSGLFGQFLAFRWEGALKGITYPDPIRFEHLIGYERARNEVIHNTERFLAGGRGTNMLLYGDRGTGKSSTIKALIHRFGEQGLRLIEVPKSRLGDFPEIIDVLKDRPQRFILFVDDLSFEDGEDSYKELKAVLEGGVSVRPENVVIYATSNRRHLIKETFADRRVEVDPDGEIRPGDTYQEKMSLADRFGITVTFLAPDQEAYLEIVEALAQQQGIGMDREELRRQAIAWEMRHNGRSGRTARQFIDSLS